MNQFFVTLIDYYIGVPLCFVFSLVNRLTGLFSGKRGFDIKKIKSTLFIELSEMGSAIIAYPAIMRLKKLNPEMEIYFLIFKRNQESVQITGCIDADKILTIRDTSLTAFFLDFMKLFIFSWKKYDLCIDFELFSRCTALLGFFSGARYQAGFSKYYTEGLYRGNFLTHEVTYNPYEHMSKNFLSIIEALAANRAQVPFPENINLEPGSLPKKQSIQELNKKLTDKLKGIYRDFTKTGTEIIIVNPIAGKYLPIRSWPLENYTELIKKILRDKDSIVILTGMKSDIPAGEKICSALNDPRCINFMGQTASLEELVELFNMGAVLITNDSGAAHFACLTDINIMTFFGPETPVLYGPLSARSKVLYSRFHCSPCLSAFNHRQTPCKDNTCLKSISPDHVYGEFIKLAKRDSK